jgi:hypothetical protein
MMDNFIRSLPFNVVRNFSFGVNISLDAISRKFCSRDGVIVNDALIFGRGFFEVVVHDETGMPNNVQTDLLDSGEAESFFLYKTTSKLHPESRQLIEQKVEVR